MNKTPLRYQISSWDQLVGCMSNYSNSLHLKVKRLVHDRRLTGTIIEVFHDEFGPLFCYTVDGQGPLLASSNPIDYEMSTSSILKELERFGFLITYNPIETLPEEQIKYLKSILDLGFDKIRILNVYTYQNDGTKVLDPNVVAFMVEHNPGWMDNVYAASTSEYTRSIVEGTAINLSAMSEATRYRWDWLVYVASISDILSEHAKQER